MMPARTPWTWGAYGLAAVFTAAIGYFLVRMPFQLTDNALNMLDLRNMTFAEILSQNFGNGPFMRPLLWATFKAIFDAAGDRLFAAFKAFHILQVAALLVLFVRLLRVRAERDFAVAAFACAVLLGYHTFAGFLVEAHPINSFLSIAVCCLAAMNLAESRGGRLVDAALVAVLLYAIFTVESGLLVWVIAVAAWLAGARGVSRGGVLASTAVVAGYFVLRFVLLDGSTPGLEERSTGFWTERLDPADLQSRFGDRPLELYGYNVFAALASLLAGDPRAGVFDTLYFRQLGRPLPPWLLLNIATTSAVSLGIAVWTARRAGRWVRLRVDGPDERMVVVFWAVALASAVLSYGYTKDQILAPAGVFFALASAAALRELVSVEWRLPALARPIAVVVLLVLSAGWTVKASGLGYFMLRSAHRERQEWLELDDWLARQRRDLNPRDAAFVNRLRDRAFAQSVPHPYFIYGRHDKIYDQRN